MEEGDCIPPKCCMFPLHILSIHEVCKLGKRDEFQLLSTKDIASGKVVLERCMVDGIYKLTSLASMTAGTPLGDSWH